MGLSTTPYKVKFTYQDDIDYQSSAMMSNDNFNEFEIGLANSLSARQNGYLELDVTHAGKYLLIYPPKDKGKSITEADVHNFLSDKGIHDIDENIISVYLKKKGKQKVPLGPWEANPANDGKIFLDLSDNHMQAFVRYTHPKRDGKYVR